MGFFTRLANWWSGFTSLWMTGLEEGNPAAVYEASINESIRRNKELKKAVSSIVMLRNKTQTDYDSTTKELADIGPQIQVAMNMGEDEAAVVLLERQTHLQSKVVELQALLVKTAEECEDAKHSLVQFQGEIKKLMVEKDEMLAKKATAEARIKIQESLSGLSVDADVIALNNVRNSIHKLTAEADLNKEIDGSGLDAKLAKIKASTGSAVARSQLEEMKRAKAAQEASVAATGGITKTM